MRHQFSRILRKSFFALLLLGLLLPGGRQAHAWAPFDNFVNGIEMFGQLPGEVNDLKRSYNETVNQLEDAKSDIQAYRDDMNTYRAQVTELSEQNERLDEQNKQLQNTVALLNKAQEERERSARTMKFIIFALVSLFIGYFLLIRVLRLGLRGRR